MRKRFIVYFYLSIAEETIYFQKQKFWTLGSS